MKYRVVIHHSKRCTETVGSTPILEQAKSAAVGYAKSTKRTVTVERLETEMDEYKIHNKIVFTATV